LNRTLGKDGGGGAGGGRGRRCCGGEDIGAADAASGARALDAREVDAFGGGDFAS
jgi:hypothetical protein